MKKLIFILCLLLLPGVVSAAYNDVTSDGNISIVLPSNGLTYTLKRGATMESITINNASISFEMEQSSILELESADKSELAYSSGCNVLSSSCTNSLSSIAIQCQSSKTLTITPSGTCSGSTGGGTSPSSGSGASSGGSGSDADKDTGQAYFTLTLSLASPFKVVFPSSAHTITAISATENEAGVTIESKAINVALVKNVSQDLDTDGNGVKDLRVTYLGLTNGRPNFKVVELAAADGSATDETSEQEASACLLKEGEVFKYPGSSAVYYITKECKKRAFNNSRVFFTYFNSWADVNSVNKDSLDDLENDTLGFMPWGPKYDPKYGALVKIVSDPKTYLLLGTEKYWITSEEIFNSLGYSWNWIEDIDESLLDKYTTGSEINYTGRHPNFTIVKYAGSPEVYLLQEGKKRHIKDETAFNSLGYRWDRIVEISDEELYVDGAELE